MEARWDTSVSNLFGLSEASSLFQAVLPRFTIMNGQNDPVLDNLVALTARLCDAPVAAINLISQEQQIFKAVYGLTLNAPPPGHNFAARHCSPMIFLSSAMQAQRRSLPANHL